MWFESFIVRLFQVNISSSYPISTGKWINIYPELESELLSESENLRDSDSESDTA